MPTELPDAIRPYVPPEFREEWLAGRFDGWDPAEADQSTPMDYSGWLVIGAIVAVDAALVALFAWWRFLA